MRVTYLHPIVDENGKFLSTANILWADRDHGDCYYPVSRYAMKAGRFPATHPCAPFDDVAPDGAQIGGSKRLSAFRQRGYWASCFPEGDGITLKWWGDGETAETSEKTAEQVMRDIRECFGWEVERRL